MQGKHLSSLFGHHIDAIQLEVRHEDLDKECNGYMEESNINSNARPGACCPGVHCAIKRISSWATSLLDGRESGTTPPQQHFILVFHTISDLLSDSHVCQDADAAMLCSMTIIEMDLQLCRAVKVIAAKCLDVQNATSVQEACHARSPHDKPSSAFRPSVCNQADPPPNIDQCQSQPPGSSQQPVSNVQPSQQQRQDRIAQSEALTVALFMACNLTTVLHKVRQQPVAIIMVVVIRINLRVDVYKTAQAASLSRCMCQPLHLSHTCAALFGGDVGVTAAKRLKQGAWSAIPSYKSMHQCRKNSTNSSQRRAITCLLLT